MERYVKEFYKLSPEEQLEFFGTYGDYRRTARWIQPLLQKMKLPLCVGITVAGLSIGGASASDDVQPRKNLFALPPEKVAVDNSKLSPVPPIQPAANVPTETTDNSLSATNTTQSEPTQPKSKVVENAMTEAKKEPIQLKKGTPIATSTPQKTYAPKTEVKKQPVTTSKPQTKLQTIKKKIDFSDIPTEAPSKKEENDLFFTTNLQVKNREKVHPFHFHVSKELDQTHIDLTISGTIKEETPVTIQPYDEKLPSKETDKSPNPDKSIHQQQPTIEPNHSADQDIQSEVKRSLDQQLKTTEVRYPVVEQQVTKKIKQQTSQLLTHLEQLLENESIKEIIIKTETKTYLIKEIPHEPTSEKVETNELTTF